MVEERADYILTQLALYAQLWESALFCDYAFRFGGGDDFYKTLISLNKSKQIEWADERVSLMLYNEQWEGEPNKKYIELYKERYGKIDFRE